MAAMPLSFTVDTALSKMRWRRSALSFLSSLAIQALALLALALGPLLSMSALPEPAGRLQLPEFVSVVPVARPEATPAKRTSSSKPERRVGFRRAFAAPAFTPVGISEEVDDTGWLLEPSGVPDGALDGSSGFGDFGIGAPPPAPAEEAPTSPIAVGGDVAPPYKRYHVSPLYPPVALAARIEGSVVLEAIIDAEGNVVNLRVLKSIPLLDDAAMDAVRRWKYEPTRLNGRPVPIVMSVTVTFFLKR